MYPTRRSRRSPTWGTQHRNEKDGRLPRTATEPHKMPSFLEGAWSRVRVQRSPTQGFSGSPFTPSGSLVWSGKRGLGLKKAFPGINEPKAEWGECSPPATRSRRISSHCWDVGQASLPREWAAVVSELKKRPRPRSPSFTTPVAVMNTLAGLMSAEEGEGGWRGAR